MSGRLLRLLLLLFVSSLYPNPLLSTTSNDSDYKALVSFKHQLLQLLKQMNNASSAIDMSSWNDTNKHFCSWEGVSCGRKHLNRVTALDLSSSGLFGPLPPSIANLTFLRRLDLSVNQLYGEIPPNLAGFPRLQYLDLSFNSFYGDISTILMTNDSVLKVLDFSDNQFTGKIPHVTISMSRLKFLSISRNHIIGTIPPSLYNLSFLESMHASDNHLEGAITPEIGLLNKLRYIYIAGNNLFGNIPSSFYNISSLRGVSVANNQLSGEISTNLARAFPYLEFFFIGMNHFIGSLDPALQNVTSLVELDVGTNNFIGVVPSDLGKMHNLMVISLQKNMFQASDAQDWRFFNSLTNCTKLQTLGLNDNHFSGMLPKSFGNLSTNLQIITLGSNYISGSIPIELGRYTSLINFGMEYNLLGGQIPESIGKLGKLQILGFKENNLTGIIPDSLGNLTRLGILWLGGNQLTGIIPSSVKNLQVLFHLDLNHNNLTGLIPSELFLIPSFSDGMDLSYNSFTGILPLEVGNLKNTLYLDFSNNNLTGEIPETFQSCLLLLELYMEHNFFYGSIPISLSNMKSLENLDLSHNSLSGIIPQSLQNLTSLKYLNLSFNNLEGEVPKKGVFANSSEISLIGNEKICGGILKLHLPKCTTKPTTTSRSHLFIKILIPTLSILVMLFIFLLYYIFFFRKHKKNSPRGNSPDSSLSTAFPRISYAKLAKATNNFSTSSLIGCGKYGSVYRGILREYQAAVAIKVFKLEVHEALKTFTFECDALRRIRHRNLVRVLTSCSSIDHQGRDFKALIFEFMSKGNLDMWLHQEYAPDGDVVLSLEKRLNIAINVADALDYLHWSCEPSIIHCDVKPSNILLDNSMTAYVGDFGLSRMLSETMSMTSHDSSNKSEIKGTIGYVAPEYGVGARLSTSADVYSFGIVLLEMLTGRRPTDDIFKDSHNLYNYVEMIFPHRINDIVDLKMFPREERDANKRNCQFINECLLSLAAVGLSCSTLLPEERPSMREVATKLHSIRVAYLQSDANREFSNEGGVGQSS